MPQKTERACARALSRDGGGYCPSRPPGYLNKKMNLDASNPARASLPTTVQRGRDDRTEKWGLAGSWKVPAGLSLPSGWIFRLVKVKNLLKQSVVEQPFALRAYLETLLEVARHFEM